MEYAPKISVLIPAYNAEKTISRCLKSVLNQTYTNMEIVVVNDGSTDSTQQIVQDFCALDKRVILYNKQNEKSIAKTRNYLLSKITCEYFCFIDSDDYVEKQYIQTLYSSLVKHNTDISCCSFAMQYFKRHIFKKHTKKTKLFYNSDIFTEMVLGMNMYFCLWNKMFKTELIDGIMFNPEISYGEDFLFCYKYALKCKSASFKKVKLYHYVQQKNSLMKEKIGEKHFLFLSALFELLNNEQCEEQKNCLKAWIAMTSALFIFKTKRNKNILTSTKQHLKQNVKEYGDYLLKNKSTKFLFKFLFKYIKTFYVK